MVQVVLLSLTRGTDGGEHRTERPRVPVLACADELRSAGVDVRTTNAGSDAEVDAVLAGLPDTRVIAAVEEIGQFRAVVRRLVRRYAPAPSARPDDLPDDRTVPDLPPLGLLPLAPLGAWLGAPASPAETAAAVLGGRVRRLDLLRTDAGSVTLDGAVIGGAGCDGAPTRVEARVEVDDAVLAAGGESLLAVVVANGGGYATLDGLPVLAGPDPTDGALDVAVVVAPRRRLGRRPEVEVRRARGRAVSVTPRSPVPVLDDGVRGTLTHRRTWWMERSALALHG